MTKRQAERYYRLRDTLVAHGLHQDGVDALLRWSRVLHRLGEDQCNGVPECYGREPRHLLYKGDPKGPVTACNEALITKDNVSAKLHTTFRRSMVTCPACKADVIERRIRAFLQPGRLTPYFQGDPRGCMLYLIRPGDVPEGKDVNAYYTNGIAVCID